MFLFDRWYVDGYTVRRGLLLLAAALLAAAGTFYLLTGDGPASVVSAEDGAGGCRAYAVDVGTSTARGGDTSLRQDYLNEMSKRLREDVEQGVRVHLGFFAGQPPRSLYEYSFDEKPESEFEAAGAESQKLVDAQAQLTRQLTQPDLLTDGSAVIATVGRLVTDTPAGCDLLIISDGIENSEFGRFGVGGHTPLAAAGAVEALIDRVAGRDAIPDLSGRRFTMPFLGSTSGEAPDDRYGPQRRRAATRRFWELFADGAGTKLTAPSE